MKVVVVTHRGSVEKVYVNNKRIENFQTHDEAYHGQYRAPNKKKKQQTNIPVKPRIRPKQMQMTITLTPMENINTKKNKVIDNEQNFKWVFDWYDGIEVKRVSGPEIIYAKDLSTKDTVLHRGAEYKILHLLSKPTAKEKGKGGASCKN
jgi:hypothetical protein